MIATSGFLTALGCTKFVFGRGSASDPSAGGAYSAPPDPYSWFKGPTSIGERREGREIRKDGKADKEGKARNRGPAPFRKFLDPPMVILRLCSRFSASVAT